MVFTATAFINCSRLTISATNAWRAGIIRPIRLPIISTATIKIHHEPSLSGLIKPEDREKAIPRATTAEANTFTMTIRFFLMRSAIAPPKRDTSIIGKALTKAMVPSKVFDPVRWYIRNGPEKICILKAVNWARLPGK